jgi:hypothetical protein
MPDGIETHAIIYAGGTPATVPGYMPSGKKIPKLECRLAYFLACHLARILALILALNVAYILA